MHAGGVQNRQAPACIFLPVATQDHHIPAITGGELDCCCTPEAFKIEQAPACIFLPVATQDHTSPP
ncbi:MAG: hypothetical protein ACLR23_22605 [Clostridia bacterium]